MREMRRLHLGLMQRGKNLNKRSHCLLVADVLLERAARQADTAFTAPSPDRIAPSALSLSRVEPTVTRRQKHVGTRAYTQLEQQVLKYLPKGPARTIVVRRLQQSIDLAAAAAPMQWGLSVLRGFLRLNAGMIEVATAEPNLVRLLVLQSRIPKECEDDPQIGVLRSSPNPNSGVYPSVPQSALVAIRTDHPRLDALLNHVLADAHARLIERAATTRVNPMTRRAHKAEAVDLIRELSRQSQTISVKA